MSSAASTWRYGIRPGARISARNRVAAGRIPYLHVEAAEDIERDHPSDTPSRMAPLGQGGDKQHAGHCDRRRDVETDLDIPQIVKHLGPLSRC